MTAPSGASLVVPNWNGRELLRANVPSLLAAAQAHGACEVLVVDDGSTDDSVSVLEREFPGVTLVRHEKNRGFGPACLSGVQAARHPVVVLLNSDVVVEPGFVTPLLEPFSDPGVFAVSPLILDREGKVAKVSVNRPYIRRGELRWEGADPAKLDSVVASLFPLGGAVALDRARFLELGGFDPLYEPFYYEDVDLGLCAWRRGWKCLVEPRSRVRHDEGGTINKHFGRFKVKVAKRRHRLLMTWKHATGSWLRAHLAWLPVKVVTKAFKLDLRFHVALLQALARLPRALRARRREREATRVPLEEAFRIIRS